VLPRAPSDSTQGLTIFYQRIEWAARQPWSNGKIGLSGVSYFGINHWHVASLQPPHLTAMCIWEGAADWYRDMTHHGGILSPSAELVRRAGEDRAIWSRRTRPEASASSVV
jgi:putative CocE/NonD family hydrolase